MNLTSRPMIKKMSLSAFIILQLLLLNCRAGPPPSSRMTQSATAATDVPQHCIETFDALYGSSNTLVCLYCEDGYTLTTVNYTCVASNANWPFIALTQLESTDTSCVQITDTTNPCSAIAVENTELSLNIDLIDNTVTLTNLSNSQSRVLQVTNFIDNTPNSISCSAINTADFSLLGFFELTTNVGQSLNIAYNLLFPDCSVTVVLYNASTTTNTPNPSFIMDPWLTTAQLEQNSQHIINQQQPVISSGSANTPLSIAPYSYTLSSLFALRTNFQFLDSDLNVCQTEFTFCNDQGVAFSLCAQLLIEGLYEKYVPVFTLIPIPLFQYIYNNGGATANNDEDVLSSLQTQDLLLAYRGTNFEVIGGLIAIATKLWLHETNQFSSSLAQNFTVWTNITTNNQFYLLQLWFNQIVDSIAEEQENIVGGAPPAPNMPAPQLPPDLIRLIMNNYVQESNSQYSELCWQSFQGSSTTANLVCSLQLYSLYFGGLQEDCVSLQPSLAFDLDPKSSVIGSNSEYYVVNWAPYGPLFNTLCSSVIDAEEETQYNANEFDVYSNVATIISPNETLVYSLPENSQLFLPLINFLTDSTSYVKFVIFDFETNQCTMLQNPSVLKYNNSLSIISQPVFETGLYFVVTAACDASCLSCDGPAVSDCLSCDTNNYIYWESEKRCLPLVFDAEAVLPNCLSWTLNSSVCKECNSGFVFAIDSSSSNDSSNSFQQEEDQECNISSISAATEFYNNYATFLTVSLINSASNLTNLIAKLISDVIAVQTKLNEVININSILQGIYEAYEIAQVDAIATSSQNCVTSIYSLSVEVLSLPSLGFIVNGNRLLSTNPPSQNVIFTPNSASDNVSAPAQAQSLSYVSCSSSFCDPPFCDNSLGPWSKLNFLDSNNDPLPADSMLDGNFELNLTVYMNLSNYESVSLNYWNSTSQSCTPYGLSLQNIVVESMTATSFVSFSSQVTGGYFVLTGENSLTDVYLYGYNSSSTNSSDSSLLWLLMLLLIIPLSTVPIYYCYKRYHKHILHHQKEHRKNRKSKRCLWFYSYCNPLFLLWILTKNLWEDLYCCLRLCCCCCCSSWYCLCWVSWCCICCKRKSNKIQQNDQENRINAGISSQVGRSDVASLQPQQTAVTIATTIITEKPPLYSKPPQNLLASPTRIVPSRQDTHDGDREESKQNDDSSMVVTPGVHNGNVYNAIKKMNDSHEIPE